MRYTFLPAALLAISACSTTSTGTIHFFVGEGEPKRDNERLPAQLEQLAKEWACTAAPGVLVVGDVGALHKVDRTDFAGWTSIETLGMGGFIKLERPAAVRPAEIDAVGFASGAAALFGTTGDLVAARSNAAGVLVIERVLCKEQSADFKACAKRFMRGHFDLAGAELDSDLHPKRDGRRIDPSNYASLPHGGAP
ncbi:hypothetical protein [Pseudoduganella violaceinigra]|uniref:hypothetical protein n=1 Tax=Pseudoduganella violaceinigra TaxID=246602 RepID=UPI0004041E9E|nr:hypothetical protein [Pseudoduganella violaceinigra]